MTATKTGPDAASDSGAPATTHSGAHPGRTDLGAVTIADRVVAKIVTRAVSEVPDAGSATRRILGRPASVHGLGSGQLGEAPKVSVDVDLSVTSVEVTISVRWPASVPEVTSAVRERIVHRLAELTGLTVADVRIHVSELLTRTAPARRVR
ncbi:Asp23/Gls24 family envelope stress response protein [uncultured Jatrophihabitans sp.]|uniref:Asp23/Gls24 family envelope stress response protein n=1 Tax=uncultured Jatrophihabitans sp. TaxID=1610747 RepID=UPI0035C9A214